MNILAMLDLHRSISHNLDKNIFYDKTSSSLHPNAIQIPNINNYHPIKLQNYQSWSRQVPNGRPDLGVSHTVHVSPPLLGGPVPLESSPPAQRIPCTNRAWRPGKAIRTHIIGPLQTLPPSSSCPYYDRPLPNLDLNLDREPDIFDGLCFSWKGIS